MAANYTIYVPDRAAPLTVQIPTTVTAEQARQILVSSGYTSLDTAEVCQDGNTLRFNRVRGGTKGL